MFTVVAAPRVRGPRLIWLLICCCTVLCALDPSPAITQHGHTAWRLGQNGLEGSPTSIAQTMDGYIWVGTNAGLFRFDGIHFTQWNPPANERLPSSYIFRLLGSHDGSLYIGTELGLARLRDGHLYTYPDDMKWVGPLTEDAQGTVWTGQYGYATSSSMLCKVGPEHVSCMGTKDGFGCQRGTAILSEMAGSVWVGSDQGVCHWQQGKAPVTDLLPSLTSGNAALGNISGLAWDGAELWAGSRALGPGRGLLKLTDGKWKTYLTPLADGRTLAVTALLSDRFHSLWIGTEQAGLGRISEGVLDRFNTADGLTGNAISSIFEDREGNIWVTTSEGIDCFRALPVVTFSSREGLSDDAAHSAAVDSEGAVWVGTFHLLNILKNGRFRPVRSLPAESAEVWMLDSRNHLWIQGGVRLFDYWQGRFVPVRNTGDLQMQGPEGLAEDSDHEIWESDLDQKTRQKALFHIRGEQVVEKFPTPENQTLFIAANPRGGLWAGGWMHGLYRFHYGRFDRVPANIFDKNVFRLTEDPDGSLWILTVQHELYLYREGRAALSLSSRNGLPCDSAGGVVNDRAGSHWLYLQCGIVRVDDAELNRWEQNSDYRVKIGTRLDFRDGARVSGVVPPVLAPDGRIWTVNERVVQVIDPRRLPRNDLPPPVHIERLIVDGKDYPKSGPSEVPVTPHDLEIDYVGLSYVVPEKVRFQYRLFGHDSSWTEAGTRRQAFYNNLRPGRYTFLVRACNNDGLWNTAGATLAFVVPPAWFQTAWFGALSVISGLCLVYVLYLLRLRQYSLAMKKAFDERLEERTRLARDLHDTLLQTIQGSKMLADDAIETADDLRTARATLGRLSGWLGRATAEGRAVLESLRQSISETNDLAAAFRRTFEDYGVRNGITLHLSVMGKSRELHPIARDEVYSIGDEAIRNACIHSGGSSLWVELCYDQNLRVSVRDDGCGMGADTVRDGRPGHYGLAGLRERAQRIGARLVISSSQDGTEIVLRVPGRAIYSAAKPDWFSRFRYPFEAARPEENDR